MDHAASTNPFRDTLGVERKPVPVVFDSSESGVVVPEVPKA